MLPTDPPMTVADVFDVMDGVYSVIKDKNSVFLWVNDNFARLVGRKKEDLIGQKDDQEAHVAHDREVMESGIPLLNFNETIIVPTSSGDKKEIEIVTQKGLLRKKGGDEIIGITVCFSLKYPEKNADYWIEKLKLKLNDDLGGFFKSINTSKETFLNACLPERFQGDRRFHGENYYLLKAGEVLALHSLNQDETWYYNVGSAIRLHIFSEEGKYQERILGDNVDAGQELQVVVPHNHWFGAEVVEGGSFSLCSCSLAPAWDERDSFLPKPSNIAKLKKELKKLYPDRAKLIEVIDYLATNINQDN